MNKLIRAIVSISLLLGAAAGFWSCDSSPTDTNTNPAYVTPLFQSSYADSYSEWRTYGSLNDNNMVVDESKDTLGFSNFITSLATSFDEYIYGYNPQNDSTLVNYFTSSQLDIGLNIISKDSSIHKITCSTTHATVAGLSWTGSNDYLTQGSMTYSSCMYNFILVFTTPENIVLNYSQQLLSNGDLTVLSVKVEQLVSDTDWTIDSTLYSENISTIDPSFTVDCEAANVYRIKIGTLCSSDWFLQESSSTSASLNYSFDIWFEEM